MNKLLILGLALAGLTAACDKPAEPAAPPADPVADATTPAAPEIPADRSTPAQRAEAEAGATKAGVPVTRESRGLWKCDNGEEIEVRFFPDQGIAVLVRGGQNVEMQSVPTVSGFKYMSGPTSIEGKGEQFTLSVGMVATTVCIPA